MKWVGTGSFARPDPVLVVLCLMPGLLAANGLITQWLGDSHPLGTAYGGLKDALLAALTLRLVATGRWRCLPRPLVVLTLVFLAIGLVGMAWSTSPLAAAYGFRNDFYPALWLLVAAEAFVAERRRSMFAVATAVTAVVSAVVLMVTWSFGLEWLVTLGILPQEKGEAFPASFFSSGLDAPRGFSPWEAPNIAGVVLVMMLAVVVLALPGRPWVRWLVSASLLPAIWLTGSRSSLLGLAAVVSLVVLRHVWLRWGRRGMVVSGLAVTAVVATGVWSYFFRSGKMGDDPSLVGHSDSLVEGFNLVVDHPWGVGVGDAGPRSVAYSDQAILLESSWLLLAVEASLLATIVFVLLQAYPLVRCVSMSRVPHAFVAPAVIAASLVSQLVLPSIQESPFSHFFWIAVGLGMGAMRQASLDGPASGSPARVEVQVPKKPGRHRPAAPERTTRTAELSPEEHPPPKAP